MYFFNCRFTLQEDIAHFLIFNEILITEFAIKMLYTLKEVNHNISFLTAVFIKKRRKLFKF